MISYNDFLALAETEDVRVLNLLAQGQVIRFTDPAEADAMFARIERLYGAGFIIDCDRGYRKTDGGGLEQRFSAIVEPAASVYLARCTAERLALSREPLPDPEPQA